MTVRLKIDSCRYYWHIYIYRLTQDTIWYYHRDSAVDMKLYKKVQHIAMSAHANVGMHVIVTQKPRDMRDQLDQLDYEYLWHDSMNALDLLQSLHKIINLSNWIVQYASIWFNTYWRKRQTWADECPPLWHGSINITSWWFLMYPEIHSSCQSGLGGSAHEVNAAFGFRPVRGPAKIGLLKHGLLIIGRGKKFQHSTSHVVVSTTGGIIAFKEHPIAWVLSAENGTKLPYATSKVGVLPCTSSWG